VSHRALHNAYIWLKVAAAAAFFSHSLASQIGEIHTELLRGSISGACVLNGAAVGGQVRHFPVCRDSRGSPCVRPVADEGRCEPVPARSSAARIRTVVRAAGERLSAVVRADN